MEGPAAHRRLDVITRQLTGGLDSASGAAAVLESVQDGTQLARELCPNALQQVLLHDNGALRNDLYEFLKVSFEWCWCWLDGSTHAGLLSGLARFECCCHVLLPAQRSMRQMQPLMLCADSEHGRMACYDVEVVDTLASSGVNTPTPVAAFGCFIMQRRHVLPKRKGHVLLFHLLHTVRSTAYAILGPEQGITPRPVTTLQYNKAKQSSLLQTRSCPLSVAAHFPLSCPSPSEVACCGWGICLHLATPRVAAPLLHHCCSATHLQAACAAGWSRCVTLCDIV